MIKFSENILKSGFLKVFNKIFKAGELPEMWTEGLMTPIHKSGNSRGICVSRLYGQTVCSILKTRLINVTNSKKLLHPSQIGFMPERRTADDTLTIKTPHDKFVKDFNSGKFTPGSSTLKRPLTLCGTKAYSINPCNAK